MPKQFDVVVLTAPDYLTPKKDSVLTANVILEDQLVLDALAELGLRVSRVSWDSQDFDWASTHFALIRSTWDYIHRVDEFSSWLKRASKQTKFINPISLIDWNMDKIYLKELNASGIHIPKTLFIPKGSQWTLHQAWENAKRELGFNSNTLVLKPCISGGARHTYKFDVDQLSQYEVIFAELISNEALMLQEFQQNIVDHGEISMMLFNGEFTHAVLKIAKAGDFRVQDDYGGSVHEYKPNANEIAFAEATVKATPQVPMYARVDIFKDNENKIALAELEIFEPELWFRLQPNAAKVLAKHIKEQLFKNSSF